MSLRMACLALALSLAACSEETSRRPDGGADATLADGATAMDTSRAEAGSKDLGDADAGTSKDAGEPAAWCTDPTTVVGKAIAGLAPGAWVQLPQNPTLDQLDMHNHLLSWSDTAAWNPVHRKVQWVGSPGSCCETPARYVLVEYDLPTNTWTRAATPWVGVSGHAYDGIAADPATGTLFFARSNDVRSFDQQSWTKLPSPSFKGPIAVGATYFAAVDKLVFVGSKRKISLYDKSKWTTHEAKTGAGWGTYHTFAEYNPVHEVVWLGGGNGGGKKSYALDKALGFRELTDAPVDLSAIGSNHKTYDPTTGTFIVHSKDKDKANESFWEFDIVADKWKDITTSVKAKLPSNWKGANFVAPVDDCGVLLYVYHRFTDRRVYLYRPNPDG